MRLVGTKEAAVILGTPEGTLRYWKCIGKGPRTFTMFGRLRYDVEDLEQFIESCRDSRTMKGNYEPVQASA